MTASRKIFHYFGVVTLLVWGLVLLYFFASGRIVNYLKFEFRVCMLIGGLLMLVLGLFNLFTSRVKPGHFHEHLDGDEEDDHAHAHDHSHEHEHEHERVEGHAHGHGCDAGCSHGDGHEHEHDHEETTIPGVLVTFLILLAPLLAAAAISPDGFSGDVVVNKGLYTNTADAFGAQRAWGDRGKEGAGTAEDPFGKFTLDDLKAQVDQSPKGDFLLSVPTLFYSAGDRELQDVMDGLPVETTGQVMPEKVNNPDGTRLRLFRLFIECCAADARPLGLPLEFGKKAPDLPEMSWVKVIGKMEYVQENDATVAVIRVESIVKTEAPPEKMMF